MKFVKNRPFTLVELLVVIAVISILAGLLLPALKTARMSAKRITCMANTKQCTISLLHYLTDYNSFPFINNFAPPNPGSLSVYGVFDLATGDLPVKSRRCSEMKLGGLGLNTNYVAGTRPVPDRPYQQYTYTLANIKNPSRKALIFDFGLKYVYWPCKGIGCPGGQGYAPGTGKILGDCSNHFSDKTTPEYSDFMIGRHLRQNNMTFVDGHAETISAENFAKLMRNGPSFNNTDNLFNYGK